MTSETKDWDPNELHGTRLGSCVVERTLGHGAMGVVYLARQLRPRRQVAVKVLHPQLAASPEVWRVFLARFRDEADAAAALDHANIVPIFEFGQEGDIAFLVMPYLADGSLAALLARGGRLTLADAIAYVGQAAAALDCAHAHGLIHRDVKPSNLLLHPDGRLMLADFGIARPMDRIAGETSDAGTPGRNEEFTAGTPEYMAPEQVRGGPLTPAADIYALGIVAYAMLAGQTPFAIGARGDARGILARQLADVPPPLRPLRPDVSARVEEVILRALAKDPANRPASAGAFAEALREAARSRTLGGILNRGVKLSDAPRGPLQLASPMGGAPSRPSTPMAVVRAPVTPAFSRRANGTHPLTDPHLASGSGARTAARPRVTPPPIPDTAGQFSTAFSDNDAPTLFEGGAPHGGNMPTFVNGGIPVWPGADRGPISAQARHVRRNRPALKMAAVAAVALLGFACLLGGLSQTGLFAVLARPDKPIAAGTPEPTATTLPTATPDTPANWLSVTPDSLNLGCKGRRGQQATITLTNQGDTDVRWSADIYSRAITLSKYEGRLSAHSHVSITVTNVSTWTGDQGNITFTPDADEAGDPAVVSYTTQGCGWASTQSD